jgi:hypothetical protein
VSCRKSKKGGSGDGAEQQQRTIKMQPLLDDGTEPAAPGTPEPPSREAEPEPAAAAVDAVAEALKGNETLFSGQVRVRVPAWHS